jgi:CRP-like cAMP-binding protein
MTVLNRSGIEHEVLILKTGEFFGMITLFSGEPSVMSVTALGDLEVMRLSATVVNQMIDRQPTFARELSQVLEIRRRAMQSVMESSPESTHSRGNTDDSVRHQTSPPPISTANPVPSASPPKEC